MNLATLAVAELTAEAFFHQVVETVAQGLEPDAVYHLAHEGELQEQTGLGLADAALTHIEERLLVELAHGAAVGALHIVGVDLERRLRVHAGIGRGAEVGVHLV